MNDILPAEIGRWQAIESAFGRSMERLGYREIRTPYVEATPLFVRAIGEATDVVEKEMYSFSHHDEPLTLRPEGTAGAVRAYVEHGVHNSEPVTRWYYLGPMFRAERPQRGRYRQFYQLGAECIGDPGPGCDAEMIDALVGFLREIGIATLDVFINSIGSAETRAKYKDALVAKLGPMKDKLSNDSQRRLSTNPLRILDSKHPADAEAVASAPTILDFLGEDDRKHWDELRASLDALGTPYQIDPKLVRGLDYYRRTLFEIKGAYEKLGAGSTLVGGGRYDGMVKELGGPEIPSIGFAAGLERLLIASDLETNPNVVDVFVAPIGDTTQSAALVLAREVRRAGLRCEVDTRKASMKAQLRRANSLGARVCLILGDRELNEGVVEMKDLAGHAQEKVPRADVVTRAKAVVESPKPAGASRGIGMRRSMHHARIATAFAIVVGSLLLAANSFAQGKPPGGGGGGPGGGGPTQSRPTRNKTVGPQRGAGDDPDDQGPSPSARPGGEPSVIVPTDPLAVPDPIKASIGTDHDGSPPQAEGSTTRSFFPYYEERKGDYRLRLIPPLYLEHTRGLDPNTGATTERTDRESLFGILFYQRRSPKMDADVLFPAIWRVRDRENHVIAVGPLAHREAPNEHDNWVAPLVFEGKRKDGGYFHAPIALTTSHWGEKGAFTLVGPYFRDRTLRDVDWGIAPLVFHGDNGDVDGARKTYTLIPPGLYFHRERELDESALTVVGPVIAESNPKRSIFDVAPLFFSIRGRPETGGVRESHTTLFPLFHYGTSPEKTLFVIPGYLRRVTKTADTMLTPFYSHLTTRNRATSTTVVGPLLPLYYRSTDTDIGYSGLGIFPFYFGSSSPKHSTFLTPLFGRFESFNVSRTYWVFPNITYTRDVTGWETDIDPFVYLGREKQSSHTVLAPFFWDFANTKGRTTVGFPFYWRFADTTDGTVTQVAANTLYRERKVSGGVDWQFHLLPLFSYGQSPTGHWWNVLFGLAGYDRDNGTSKIKAFWVPITVSSPGAPTSRQ